MLAYFRSTKLTPVFTTLQEVGDQGRPTYLQEVRIRPEENFGEEKDTWALRQTLGLVL